jgi:putative SOS response-associated peptidase YedK
MINARFETASTKPSFRNAFKHRRCLIAADGFYEWKKTGSRKQPYFITLASSAPFGFAGLWETWKNTDGTGREYCAILTIPSKGFMEEIHHRMPVILPPDVYGAWLDLGNTDIPMLEALVASTHVRELSGYPVSTYVNSPRNNSPKCIEPLEGSLSL